MHSEKRKSFAENDRRLMDRHALKAGKPYTTGFKNQRHGNLIGSIGIDKESKSNSFFCCSLYMDERRFFTQKEFVGVCVCPVQFVFVKRESGSNISLGVQSKPKTH